MALKSQGVTLEVSDGAGTPVFSVVGEISGITGVGSGAATEIDVTNLSSTAKEFIMGLRDEGTISITGFLDPDDTAGQVRMRTLRDTSASTDFKITLTDSPATVLSFEAFVPTFGFDINPDGAIPMNGSLRVTGAVTWA